jgi:hypothetical protein
VINRIKAGLFRVREVVASSETRGNLESVGIVTAEVYSHIDDECPECGVRENFIQGGLESSQASRKITLPRITVERYDSEVAGIGTDVAIFNLLVAKFSEMAVKVCSICDRE